MAARNSPPVVPAGWTATVDRELALQHGAPHTVVSQVLRPDVAACLPTDAVKLRCASDAQCCVTTLSLGADNVMSSSDVDFAAGLRHLTEVDLSNSAVNLAGVASLSKLRQLRTLRLVNCKLVEAMPVPTIELVQLQHLDASGCYVLLDVLSLPRLHSLDHKNRYAAPEACAVIAERFPTVRRLDLSSNELLNAVGLTQIARLPELEHLSLGLGCDVDAVALAQIAKASTLRRLDLNTCCNLDGDGLAELAKLPNLRYLNVSDNALEFESFAAIATIATLEELDLHGCTAMDASLEEISQLPKLHRLDLRNATGVTPAGVAHLGRMAALRSLDLRGCAAITAQTTASVLEHVSEVLLDD